MDINRLPISKRLKMDAALVEEGAALADVGCDHAYCSIYLAVAGKIRHGIAMDVREGPLARAEENIRLYGMENRLETRLSDGLEQLKPGEADCILIGGMGGALIQKILSKGIKQTAKCRSLVLQPQSEAAALRRYLHRNGWWITAEDMCREEGKYYTVIRAERMPKQAEGAAIPEYFFNGGPDITAEQAENYGPCLIRERHPVLIEYLHWEYDKKEALSARLLALSVNNAAKCSNIMEGSNVLNHSAAKCFNTAECSQPASSSNTTLCSNSNTTSRSNTAVHSNTTSRYMEVLHEKEILRELMNKIQ